MQKGKSKVAWNVKSKLEKNCPNVFRFMASEQTVFPSYYNWGLSMVSVSKLQVTQLAQIGGRSRWPLSRWLIPVPEPGAWSRCLILVPDPGTWSRPYLASFLRPFKKREIKALKRLWVWGPNICMLFLKHLTGKFQFSMSPNLLFLKSSCAAAHNNIMGGF